jgi:hypothetical protein
LHKVHAAGENDQSMREPIRFRPESPFVAAQARPVLHTALWISRTLFAQFSSFPLLLLPKCIQSVMSTSGTPPEQQKPFAAENDPLLSALTAELRLALTFVQSAARNLLRLLRVPCRKLLLANTCSA